MPSSPNPQVNAAIQQQLEVYNQMTNFNGYLAFIMSQMKSEPEEIRSVAGLLLKQNIRNYFDKLGDILKYVCVRRNVLGWFYFPGSSNKLFFRRYLILPN